MAVAIVLTLALRGLHDTYFLRATGAFVVALTIWMAVKIMFPSDDYFANALMRAALHFFDLTILRTNIVLLLSDAIVGYVFIYFGLSRAVPSKAHLCAMVGVVMAMAIYWLWFDQSVHASNRYYLRTALVLVTPALGITRRTFRDARRWLNAIDPKLRTTLGTEWPTYSHAYWRARARNFSQCRRDQKIRPILGKLQITH